MIGNDDVVLTQSRTSQEQLGSAICDANRIRKIDLLMHPNSMKFVGASPREL